MPGSGGYTRRARPIGRDLLDSICFEDLPLGGQWTTRRRTITAADLTAFVGTAGDFNPLFIDETYARGTAFGGTVVPGTLIAAVAVGLGSLDVPIPASAGMVGMSWRFLHPVRPGDSLQTVWRLNRKRPVENPDVGLCFWQIDVSNQNGTVVATGEFGRLVERRRPTAEVPSETEAAEAAPSRSRRRRRRQLPAERERVAELVESQPLPEPANADVPPPSRRRRRRRGNGNGQSSGGQSVSERPEPEPAPPAPPPISVPEGGLRGVLRRLRGS